MKPIRLYGVPVLLAVCTLLLAFWIGASRFNEKPLKGFELTYANLADFQPEVEGYAVQLLPYVKTVTEANIVTYSLIPILPPERVADNLNPSPGTSTTNHQPSTINHSPVPSRLLTRLVHGYNMPMCMKMKYYTVEKIQDHQVRSVTDPKLKSAFRTIKSISREDAKHAKEGESGSAEGGEDPSSLRTLRTSVQAPDSSSMELMPISSDYPIPAQLWKLTSSAGTVGYWVTTMIRADDFSPTTEDICSMAFPRIESLYDPNWVPHGVRWEDLKHPRELFLGWFRGKWDDARWNVLTFLKLRKPVRTSEELLSYVTILNDVPSSGVGPGNLNVLFDVHAAMLKELQMWRRDINIKQDEEGRGE